MRVIGMSSARAFQTGVPLAASSAYTLPVWSPKNAMSREPTRPTVIADRTPAAA